MKAYWRIDNRREVTRDVHRAAARALDDGAEFVLEHANRTAPIEEAILVGSGTVTVDETALQASVSYDTPYAARQHEDTRLRHDAGRRSKWLEQTMKEQAGRVGEHMASSMRRELA